MAPLGHDTQPPLSAASPPLIGPWLPEVTSLWFRLFIYAKTQGGPESLLLTKGSRLSRIPNIFRSCENVLLTSWSHDPAVVPVANLLLTLNDALTYSPILIQSCAGDDKAEYVAFPLEKEGEPKCHFLRNHPSVKELEKFLDLNHSCGYLSFIRKPQIDKRSSSASNEESLKEQHFEDFVLQDCTFGLPLFSSQLSQQIREKLETKGTLTKDR